MVVELCPEEVADVVAEVTRRRLLAGVPPAAAVRRRVIGVYYSPVPACSGAGAHSLR